MNGSYTQKFFVQEKSKASGRFFEKKLRNVMPAKAGIHDFLIKEVAFLEKKAPQKTFVTFTWDVESSRVKVAKVFCRAFFQKSAYFLPARRDIALYHNPRPL
jgi:hypothetical protein